MFFCVLKVGGSSFRDDIWSRTADQKGQLEQEWKTHLDVFLVCLEGERELIQRRHLEQDGRSERTIGTGAEDTFKCVFLCLESGRELIHPSRKLLRCCSLLRWLLVACWFWLVFVPSGCVSGRSVLLLCFGCGFVVQQAEGLRC